MYDYIKGLLVHKFNNTKSCVATVEANGVGYLLEITKRDFDLLNLNEEVRIYTVLLHREDKMSLCGFVKREDRDIFNILTSVSGVGSKMALTLLDEFQSSELIGFVIQGDYKELTRAKGVGQKLAQKIILELKDKLMNYSEPMDIRPATVQNSQDIEDATAVLISLGYSHDEIKTSITKAVATLEDNATAQDILKTTLQILSTPYLP